jgi:hypothetical protein
MEINLDAKFTVVIGTARGAFEHEGNAKQEAMDLAYKNRPKEVWIEDEEGEVVFSFEYKDEAMSMTTITQDTFLVDYEVPDDS